MRREINTLLSCCLLLAAPAGLAGPAKKGALRPGKVKLVRPGKRVQLMEGGKQRAYYRLTAGKPLKLRAGGPTALVFLSRTRGQPRVRFELALDDGRQAELELELNRRVTRGFYVPIPEGTHRLVLAASQALVIRPARVRRKPRKDEPRITWQQPENREPEPVAVADARPAAPPPPPPADAVAGGDVASAPGPEPAPAPRPGPEEASPPTPPPAQATPGAAEDAPPAKPNLLEQQDGPRSVLVMDVDAEALDAKTIAPINDALAAGLARYEDLTVSSTADMRQLLDHEQQHQLLACKDDSQCMAGLANSLRTDWVLSGTLGRVGKSLVFTLTLVDLKQARPIARASETFAHLDAGVQIIPSMLARLLGAGGGSELTFRLAEGQKLSLAVMDLKAEGLAEELANNLTQILSVEIKRIEGTSVISRDDVTAMLQMEEHKAMLGCDDASCMAEIGGALGVDKLVVGSVGKLSMSYVVTLRLIDVREARVDGRVTETFRGEEDQLIRAVRHAGRRLFGISPDQGGRLVVSASQEGAELHVDGEQVAELPGPPTEVDEPGRHLVRVSKSGFFDWQSEVYVDPGETTALWAMMEERPERWYHKWWVWTIMGAVVVGGATAAAVLLVPEQEPGRGQVVLP